MTRGAQEPLLFRKIQNVGTVAPLPMPTPHPTPNLPPNYITEQIILIVLLMLKYNYLLVIL